jgi:hypothetical protein
MKRAAELFAINEWSSDSALEKAWTEVQRAGARVHLLAVSHWQIVVTTHDITQLTVRGPETMATVTPSPAETEFFGIVFSPGTIAASPAHPTRRPVSQNAPAVVTSAGRAVSHAEQERLRRTPWHCAFRKRS